MNTGILDNFPHSISLLEKNEGSVALSAISNFKFSKFFCVKMLNFYLTFQFLKNWFKFNFLKNQTLKLYYLKYVNF